MALSQAALASGPYVVDEASIRPAGHSQVEAWLSWNRGSTIANIVPAVTLKAIPDVEWSVALNRTRFQKTEEDQITFQGKRRVTLAEGSSLGCALVGNVAMNTRSGHLAGGLAYGAVTVPVGNRVLVHANTGIGYAPDGRQSLVALWGVRSRAAIIPDRLALHGEVFETSVTGTGFQAGLRPTILNGSFDVDIAYARNIAGERRNWLTLGLAARF